MRTKSSEKAANDDHSVRVAHEDVRESKWGSHRAPTPVLGPVQGGWVGTGPWCSSPTTDSWVWGCLGLAVYSDRCCRGENIHGSFWPHSHLCTASQLTARFSDSAAVSFEFPGALGCFPHLSLLRDDIISFLVGPLSCPWPWVCISYLPTWPRSLWGQRSNLLAKYAVLGRCLTVMWTQCTFNCSPWDVQRHEFETHERSLAHEL